MVKLLHKWRNKSGASSGKYVQHITGVNGWPGGMYVLVLCATNLQLSDHALTYQPLENRSQRRSVLIREKGSAIPPFGESY